MDVERFHALAAARKAAASRVAQARQGLEAAQEEFAAAGKADNDATQAFYDYVNQQASAV